MIQLKALNDILEQKNPVPGQQIEDFHGGGEISSFFSIRSEVYS